MNNITLTIELCQEDRARLDNILAALEGQAVAPSIEAEPEPKKQEAQNSAGTPQNSAGTPQEAPAPAPAEELPFEPEPKKQEAPAPAPEPKPAPAPAAPEVDTATLQSKVVQLVNSGKRDEAKAIILEYASCVSQVPAEKRAEVLARLNKLEG